MIGSDTIGKKTATVGDERDGTPGAVASGGAALTGYLVVRRALERSTTPDATGTESKTDATTEGSNGDSSDER
ncbi:hypothetical protein [Natrinema marinum]|uniref:hypothetical protein n=1 Tax=Natrinema marinum TaxID=2961598 RepID=UPI0020C89B45|nr:hypothetical protein [Natrinema marinum]